MSPSASQPKSNADPAALYRGQTTRWTAVLLALREATLTMLAALATLLCAQSLAPGTGTAVLAVVLCIALSRSELDRDRQGRIEAAIALPLVGLAAVGVGLLLQRAPWIGAAVFVAGMFVSIWLRRFGPLGLRAGSLIALPFVALLTTPYIPPPPDNRVPAWLAPILVALLALLWVGLLHALARHVGFLPRRPPTPKARALPAPARSQGALRPRASTRMAIQMALGLGLAFVVGYVFFAERWAWIVLTTFIVASGNRGRLDVAYKSVLRVIGAAAGTALAMMLGQRLGSHDATTAVFILGAVYLGLWLRPLGYAWWALFVTLALALLQGYAKTPTALLLDLRLEEIVIGAAIAVAVAWFVLPVRSSDVLRRRIADALRLLADAIDPATPACAPQALDEAWHAVEQLAPSFRAARAVIRSRRAGQPADWIDTLIACHQPALQLIGGDMAPGQVRRAISTARLALRQPSELLPALQALRAALQAANPAQAPATAASTLGDATRPDHRAG